MSGEFSRDDGKEHDYEEETFYLREDISKQLRDLKRDILTHQANAEESVKLINNYFEGF